MDHIYIMAPSWDLFRYYCTKHNLDAKKTIYIDRAEQIMGSINITIFDLIGDEHGLFDVDTLNRERLMEIEHRIRLRRGVTHKPIWMEQSPII